MFFFGGNPMFSSEEIFLKGDMMYDYVSHISFVKMTMPGCVYTVNGVMCSSFDEMVEVVGVQFGDIGKTDREVEQKDPLPQIFLDCYAKSKSGNCRIETDVRVYKDGSLSASSTQDFSVKEVARVKVKGQPSKQLLRIKLVDDGNLKLFWNTRKQALIGSVIDSANITYVYELTNIL